MTYNNYFPMNYGQGAYYPNYGANAQQQTQAVNNGIIWVQGEAGAKSYLVAPNNTVQLWDSERQTIYLKSADASGMPSIKTLDYTIRENVVPNVPQTGLNCDTSDFATKGDINTLADEIMALKAKIKALTKKGGDKDE